MKPKKTMERATFQVSPNAVQALEKLRISYNGAIGQASSLEADQAVRRVVETTLENARMTRRSA